MVWGLLLTCAAFAVAYGLTEQCRRYALTHRLLDIPNARSSHEMPTPRAGGAAIVLTVLTALPALYLADAIDRATAIGMAGAGAVIAIIGFSDDRRHIPPIWRLIAQFAVAAWVIRWLGEVPPGTIRGLVSESAWPAYVFTALYLVWLLNATNFMDGIDGIASVETITVCLAGTVLYFVATPGTRIWLTPLVLAAAAGGFLMWNWPPAKIFLGSAGSDFLGLMLAALSLQAAWAKPVLFWSWVILLGAFIVDATVTLVRRVARGERFYEPHRSHAYQHAARRWGAHRPVTLLVAAINVLWLFPVAWLVAAGALDGPLGVLVAYAPLVAVALWLRAGVAFDPQRAR